MKVSIPFISQSLFYRPSSFLRLSTVGTAIKHNQITRSQEHNESAPQGSDLPAGPVPVERPRRESRKISNKLHSLNKRTSSQMRPLAIGLLILSFVFTTYAEAPGKPTFINANAGPDEMFKTAGKAYDSGDIQRAVSLYETLLENGYKYEQVYFNLGNAYFRIGEPGEAVLNFKRALLLDPRNADTMANLRFAEEHAGALVPPNNIVTRLLSQFTVKGWMSFSTILWFIFFIILIGGAQNPTFKPLSRRVAIVIAVFLFVALAGFYYQRNMDAHPEGVAVLPTQQVFSAPLSGSTVLFELPEASIVRILKMNGDWLQIKAGNQSGWIPTQAIQPVQI